MKGKSAAVLFIIVFLLTASVIGAYIGDRKSAQELPAEETVAPGEQDAAVQPPVETEDPYTAPAPAATRAPAPVYTPVPTPVPTPAPTPEPVETQLFPDPPQQPAVSDLGAGSFSSETGTGLNLRADWSARTAGDGQAEVTVSVSIVSYSLHLSALPGAVNLSLDGQYLSMDGPAVDYDGTGSITTGVGNRSFTVDLASGETRDLHLDVVWNFGGTYQEVELPAIECGGGITLSR